MDLESLKLIEQLQLENQKLKADNEFLKEQKDVSGTELNKNRYKKGIGITYKTGASKEMIKALQAQGLTNKQIAEKLGISEVTLYRRLNK